MFLPSQLQEISQRYQPDVEDLQVLLQEERLPVGSAECLQELSDRLGSDARFRRDVGFMVRSMLGRERAEAGSMDVLGVLIVAAAGARQEFESQSQQKLVRELLRFVIQQRRPEAAAAVTPAVVEVEHRRAAPTPSSRSVATRRERLSLTPPVVPDPVAAPSLMLAEEEPFWRRAHVGRLVAVLVVLVVVGAGLAIWRGGSNARTQEKASLATALSSASPVYPAVSEPERRVIVPRPSKSAPGSTKPMGRATRRVPKSPAPSVPVTIAANRPPRTVLRPEPLQPGPELNEPMSSSTFPPVPPHREPIAVSMPAGMARQGSTPGSTDVSNVFAHPEAAAITATNQVPPPPFRSKDPVLIPRNKSAAAVATPDPLGTVHTGPMGSMVSNLMYGPDPEYPAEAIAAGVEGEVMVRAVVGPRGNVVDASVVSGPPLLRAAALDAVGRWRYRPYEQDGKPMTVATTAIFDFQIPRKD